MASTTGLMCSSRHAEAAKNIGHLVALLLRQFDGFAEFAGALAFVVVAVGARGQIPAQAHGDGPGGDFGESGDDHQLAGGGRRPGESGGQREGNREAVGHADDHIADGVGGFEVRFHVHVHEVQIHDRHRPVRYTVCVPSPP